MKKNLILIMLIFVWMKGWGQTPLTDRNWIIEPSGTDEFDSPTLTIDQTRWNLKPLWWVEDHNPEFKLVYPSTKGKNTKITTEVDGGNTISFVRISAHLGDYLGHTYHSIDDKHFTEYDKIYPFTKGYMTTKPTPEDNVDGKNYNHGYFETRVRLPDDLASKTATFGEYYNFAWWLSGDNESLNIGWHEFDFFEIVNFDHLYTAKVMYEEPYGMNKRFLEMYKTQIDNNTLSQYDDPSLFMGNKIDPECVVGLPQTNNYAKYQALYDRIHLVFDGGWHKFGCEWSPNQVKFYVDDKLFSRLEGDYIYNYIDIDNITKSINPVQKLILDVPMILGFGFNPVVNPIAATDVNMDVDYIRYYKLKKDCGNSFSLDNATTQHIDLCGVYGVNQHKVYNNNVGIVIGNASPCTDCDITVGNCNNNETVSLRANDILLLDGFKVTSEGKFYAHDIDCDAIK